MRRGKNRSTQRKTSRSKEENQQQTQPTWRRRRDLNTGHISGREASDLTTAPRGGSKIYFRRGCTRLLLYLNTNKPHSFFFCKIPVALENSRSSQGGGCAPRLHPPRRSTPAASLSVFSLLRVLLFSLTVSHCGYHRVFRAE